MRKNTINIGIIGTGKHGSRYATHILNDCPNLRLKAISRRSAIGQQQGAEWGANYLSDWRKLIYCQDIEAVIAATPPTLNLAIARECAIAGKPLLLEKPLADTLASAREILSLTRNQNLRLTVAQTLRYNPIIHAMRDSIKLIGTLYGFTGSHRLEPSSLTWLEDPSQAGAGVILHTAVHLFDALRFITNQEITRVRASIRLIHNPNLEDLFTAQIEMGTIIGTVNSSKISPARCGRYEFIGSSGELHGDQIHDRLELVQGNRIIQLPHAQPCSTIIPLLHDWYAFLTDQGPNPIPVTEGLAAMKVCDACLRSARNDCWITLQDT